MTWLVPVVASLIAVLAIHLRYGDVIGKSIKGIADTVDSKFHYVPFDLDFGVTYSAKSFLSSAIKIINFITSIVSNGLRKLSELKYLNAIVGIVLVLVIAKLLTYPAAFLNNSVAAKTVLLEFPEPICNRDKYKKILIFIHGWRGDDKKTWKKFPDLVCGNSNLKDYEVISINYPTYIMNRHLRISQLAEWVDTSLSTRVKGITKNTEITIIAHSMGGLVARELIILRRLSETDHFKSLISIATPYRGANIAQLSKVLGIDDNFIADMTEDSAFLTGLQVRWNQMKNTPVTHCISSPQDDVVSQTSAFFQCGSQYSYPQWSHTEMVKPESDKDERFIVPVSYIEAQEAQEN